MTEHELLAAEHALGLLEGEELLTARGLVSTDPAFAAQVADWQTRLAPLLDKIGPITPSANLWPRIEAAIAAAGPDEVVVLRRAVRRWQIGTGIAVAASLALAVITFRPATPPQVTDPAVPMATTLVSAGANAGGPVTLVWQPDAHRLVAYSPQMRATAGHDYQLWILPKTGNPMPVGLLKAGATQAMIMPPDLASHMGAGTSLAISVEPLGGSPTGLPTGPVIASGKISAS